MKNVLVLVAFISTGCGGSEFIAGFAGMSDDAGVEASNGGEPGAGGSPAVGGATSSTGGVPPATGGITSTGGITGTGGTSDTDACVPVTHSTGTGQTWQDCAPLKTCDETRAMAACRAYCAVNGGCACADAENLCATGVSVHTPYDGVGEMVWSENCIVYRATIGAGYGSCAYAADWK